MDGYSSSVYHYLYKGNETLNLVKQGIKLHIKWGTIEIWLHSFIKWALVKTSKDSLKVVALSLELQNK